MILSVSRRTDIPAIYSEWFYNRIKKGYVLVRNPMNIHQISKISLKPEVVDCIVFWTKNPKKFIENLNLIGEYSYYFQYTVTGYGKKIEPYVPSLEESISTFIKLSTLIGKNRVIWRYDPIIITNEFDFNFHIDNFIKIASQLSGFTDKCVISFVDYYKKTIKNLSSINYQTISNQEIISISQNLKVICESHKINLVTCAEEIDLSKIGISHGKCIDDKLIEEILGISLISEKDKNQRKECGCIASTDIGAYNTCLNGCLYCYANYDANLVHNNYSKHDINSDLLFGDVTHEDKISDKKAISCKLQNSLFKVF